MKEFWKAAAIRAARTAAQCAIGVIGPAAVLTDVNWTYCLSAVILAAFMSLLTSIITGLPEVDA